MDGVKELKRQGHSIREICRRTSYSRNTVRKILREAGPIRQVRKKRFSKLDEYKAYLKKRYEETGLSAVRLTEEIRCMGFTGSVDIVRRYLNELDSSGISEKATVRFVRQGEIIIAEHERARRSGECIADPVHVAEMWKLSLRRHEVPPRPPSRLLFQAVDARPLAVYEEVLS